jgi:hypothetical protein
VHDRDRLGLELVAQAVDLLELLPRERRVGMLRGAPRELELD